MTIRLRANTLVAAGLTLVSAFVLTQCNGKMRSAGCCGGHSESSSHEQRQVGDALVAYTCPMHPEVSQPGPGTCPKCGMELVPKK